MIYKELARYAEYDIPFIEIYNEFGNIEYVLNLSEMQIEDVDIAYYDDGTPYGIIKLHRDEQTEYNKKDI